MIEAGHYELQLRHCSIAQLFWRLRGMRIRKVERDQELVLISIAGGSGEAATTLYRRLEADLRRLKHATGGTARTVESVQTESNMPLSAEEFKQWFKDGG